MVRAPVGHSIACATSPSATQICLTLLQRQEVPDRSLGSSLVWDCHHSRWTQHGIGLHLRSRGLADSGISYSRPDASCIKDLLPKIHADIVLGNHSTGGITTAIRDIMQQEIGLPMQLAIEIQTPSYHSANWNSCPLGLRWSRILNGHSRIHTQCSRLDWCMPGLSISSIFSGFSGWWNSTQGSALQLNWIMTFMIRSNWPSWKH